MWNLFKQYSLISSVLVKLLDKGLIIIMGLAHKLNIKYYSVILLENLQNICHCCGLLAEFLIFGTARELGDISRPPSGNV